MESLGSYKSAIYRHAILCETAQLTHAKRVHLWQTHIDAEPKPENYPLIDKQGRRSLDILTRTNLRLVVKIAHAFNTEKFGSLSNNDLIQEGNLGLIHGLKKYDPTKGYRISTYVSWWIRQSMQVAVQKHAYMIRLPQQRQEDLSQIHKLLDAAEGGPPSVQELAAQTGFPEEKVRSLLMWSYERRVLSLDVPIMGSHRQDMFDKSAHLGDVLPAPAPPEVEEAEITAEHEQILHLLSKLPHREATIVRGIFFEHRTPKDLAVEFNITQSRVIQIKALAVDKLRAMMIFYRAD